MTGRCGWARRRRAKLGLRHEGGRPIYCEESPATFRPMKSTGFNYWQDRGMWVGTLDEYPDYTTQGTSFEDLKEHLQDLYKELSSGSIPGVRQHAELEVA